MNKNSNNNEFTNNNGMVSQPKHPFVKEPGSELQNMNTVGAPIALSSTTTRDGVIIATGIGWAILGFVPVVGPGLSAAAGLLNVIVPFLWPEDDAGSSQISWEQLMDSVEELVDERILTSKRSDATARLEGIKALVNEYTQAIDDLKADPNNELKKDRVRDKFDDVEDYVKVSMPFFRAQGFEVPMLAMYAQAANIHLLLLRDVVQHGASWGFQQYEIDRYYNHTGLTGSPGMLQLLAQYTAHCVRWYNTGLENRRATNDWNKFNDFRRDMTLMVLDIISLWPTYDPKFYAVPTKSQLTRTVYTHWIGHLRNRWHGNPDALSLSVVENSIVPAPHLFTWLREVWFYFTGGGGPSAETLFTGFRPFFQTTLSDNLLTGELQGNYGTEPRQDITIPSPQSGDDIWKVHTSSALMAEGPEHRRLKGWWFLFTNSPTQQAHTKTGYGQQLIYTHLGLPCKNSCGDENPNLSNPCDNSSLYSHRLSNFRGNFDPTYCSYGWTHVSADHNNLIDAQKITQIPAVKASSISGGARVVKGPGSTGGDLVELDFSTASSLRLKVTLADTTKSYQIRTRSAYGSVSKSADTLTYSDFSYANSTIIPPRDSSEYTYIMELDPSDFGGLEGKFFIDKIEFIPM
uniref:Crystaline entomocidal protoxin n=1 Tax=Bacillus thuringiensis TaxID=1428 RepID=A0A2P0NZ53_BACTU|nr:Cry32S protein [Bacillus thuringiensis]